MQMAHLVVNPENRKTDVLIPLALAERLYTEGFIAINKARASYATFKDYVPMQAFMQVAKEFNLPFEIRKI